MKASIATVGFVMVGVMGFMFVAMLVVVSLMAPQNTALIISVSTFAGGALGSFYTLLQKIEGGVQLPTMPPGASGTQTQTTEVKTVANVPVQPVPVLPVVSMPTVEGKL